MCAKCRRKYSICSSGWDISIAAWIPLFTLAHPGSSNEHSEESCVVVGPHNVPIYQEPFTVRTFRITGTTWSGTVREMGCPYIQLITTGVEMTTTWITLDHSVAKQKSSRLGTIIIRNCLTFILSTVYETLRLLLNIYSNTLAILTERVIGWVPPLLVPEWVTVVKRLRRLWQWEIVKF